jgi:hypothetical protein
MTARALLPLMEMRVTPRARWILGIAASLVVVRALLPIAVQSFVNRTLDAIPGYDGHIGDVDLHLLRGAYVIDDVSLVQTSGKVPVPLFTSTRVDLSVEWRQLVRGKLVGEIDLEAPQLNFVAAPSAEGQQGLVDASWIERVKDLFPLKLNRVAVHRGTVRFRDFNSEPKVDLELNAVEGLATNLTNTPTPELELPAAVRVTAVPPGGGSFLLEGRLAPLAEQPTFSLDTSMERVALPALNDFLRAYANVDAEGGTFSAYAELVAEGGAFEGYVKPLFKDIQVAKWREDQSLGRRLWEGVVQLAAKVLENSEKEQVATRIPLRGRFDQPQPDLWAAIGGLLRNAFIQALMPGIEDTVDVSRLESKK